MGKITLAQETITNPSLPCKDIKTSQLALHWRVSWEGVLDLAVNIFFCFGVSHLQLHPPAHLSDQLELQALPGLLHGPAPRECSQSHPAGPLQVLPRAGQCLLRGRVQSLQQRGDGGGDQPAQSRPQEQLRHSRG